MIYVFKVILFRSLINTWPFSESMIPVDLKMLKLAPNTDYDHTVILKHCFNNSPLWYLPCNDTSITLTFENSCLLNTKDGIFSR